jgi:hypothetical protein
MRSIASVLLAAAFLFLFGNFDIAGQKRRTSRITAASEPAIVFAVLNDGKLLEPVSAIAKGKLATVDMGPSDVKPAKAFLDRYFSPKKSYTILFGGKPNGTATVIRSNAGTDCGQNTAEVSSSSSAAPLKGLVMALATNAKIERPGSGIRRRPTSAEREEIEALVREEFRKQGTATAVLQKLRYHNLTALDLNNDGKVEFVGSYWVAAAKDERQTLFFVAEQGSDGAYGLTYHEYDSVRSGDVMSGDVADMDTGILHELLLDVFDLDGDGASEIFTIVQAFEGNNYYAYRKEGGTWKRIFETYVYRCAY